MRERVGFLDLDSRVSSSPVLAASPVRPDGAHGLVQRWMLVVRPGSVAQAGQVRSDGEEGEEVARARARSWDN